MKIKLSAIVVLVVLFFAACSSENELATLNGTKWVSKSLGGPYVIEFTSKSAFKEYKTDLEGNGEVNIKRGTYSYGIGMVTFTCIGVHNPPKTASVNGNSMWVDYGNGVNLLFVMK